MTVLVPQVLFEITQQISVFHGESFSERAVSGELGESFGAHAAQHSVGVVRNVLPQLWVNCGEQIPRRLMPRPAEVISQFFELVKLFGHMTGDIDGGEALHEKKS